MSYSNPSDESMKIEAWKGRSNFWRKRILAVLVVVVAATSAIPEAMEETVVVSFS